ncbi:MAG: alkaline phosphatase family protein [Elusimicrobia bacterium]|nr:alkaline phosphatase family protein [Elusimicrobiota bacterium]
MKRLLSAVLISISLTGAAAPAERPRLIAIVVIDQFGTPLFERLPANGRFRARLKDAAVFPNALHDHVPTKTAPGHASISTGRPPSVHGIISNDIFNRALGRVVSSVTGPDGSKGAYRLEAPTLGDKMKDADPSSKVVSLSLKDRSAIFLGGHHPDAAVWYEADAKRFVSSSYYGPPPAWLEKTPTELGEISSVFSPRLEPLASPAADRLVLSAAEVAVSSEKLGADSDCDLLLLSFSATDLIGHRWGPDSPQMAEQLKALDDMLSDVADDLDRASGGHFVMALTADHGVLPLPESAAGRALGARRVPESTFIKRLDGEVGGAAVVAFDSPDLYLPPGIDVAAAADRIAADPDVAAVYAPDRYPAVDDYAAIFKRSYFPGRSGDLQIRVKPGVLVGSRFGTSHSTPYDYDARVPLVFLGEGVKAGVNPNRVSIESLAPTLAAAVGADLRPGDGRPVLDVLQPAPAPSR